MTPDSCLDEDEDGWGWHLSAMLEIENPKEQGDFQNWCLQEGLVSGLLEIYISRGEDFNCYWALTPFRDQQFIAR
jgi:hypothetical protein